MRSLRKSFDFAEEFIFRYFQIIPSSSQDEKLLQAVFELLEQISYGLHLSSKTDDHLFFDWFKHILLNPFLSLVSSNKDFGEMRQTKRYEIRLPFITQFDLFSVEIY